MLPRYLLGLLINILAGICLLRAYLTHERVVNPDGAENTAPRARSCITVPGGGTYKLQCRDAINDIQSCEGSDRIMIWHLENRFAVETLNCSRTVGNNIEKRSDTATTPLFVLYTVKFVIILFLVSNIQALLSYLIVQSKPLSLFPSCPFFLKIIFLFKG